MRRPGSPPRGNKYGNRKVELGGLLFDSQAEAWRWMELYQQQERGQIRDLRRQVVFELAPPVRLLGHVRLTPALRYMADFTYTVVATGQRVVEDVKGVKTTAYKIKRHLMKAVLGIDVLER